MSNTVLLCNYYYMYDKIKKNEISTAYNTQGRKHVQNFSWKTRTDETTCKALL